MLKQYSSQHSLTTEVAVLALSIAVLVTYFFPFAFDPTPIHHYTWVNFHFTSIVQNTTPDNYFVGYSYLYVDNGHVRPHYFNRYSPLTSILLHYAFSDLSLVTKIFAIKIFFTAIFIANCACAFIIARLSGLSNLAAASILLFIASQYYFLYPKDMAHFDQIALLGLFVQIILLMSGRYFAFFIFTIIALHFGRNFMLILTSICFYSCSFAKERRAAYLGLLAIHFASFLLSFGYNVFVEMRVTGSSILDTSIMNTFQRRTGILADERVKSADWVRYIKVIFERIGNGIMLGTKMTKANPVVSMSVGFSFVLFITSLILIESYKFCRSCVFLAAILPTLIFFLLAKGLVFFHDYTLMWIIPMFMYVLSQGIASAGDRIARTRSLKGWLPALKTLFLALFGVYFGYALYLDRSWKEKLHARGVIENIQSQSHRVESGATVCLKDINHHSLNALLPGAVYARSGCEFLLSKTGIARQAGEGRNQAVQ
jgi:hypothetical protein